MIFGRDSDLKDYPLKGIDINQRMSEKEREGIDFEEFF